MNFVVSTPILTSKLPVPLPHLLFTLSLITATLCTTTFQNLKQIVFRLSRTPLPGLWLRLPNYVTSPLFSNLYIGLKSTNALNINFFLLPINSYHCSTYLSAQPDLCSAPSCYSLLICCHPFSTTYISSLRISNRSFRYASPHLWNQLSVSFRQPCTNHPAGDITHSNSPPTCSPLSPSITHSLFHSRLKTHLFHKSFPP